MPPPQVETSDPAIKDARNRVWHFRHDLDLPIRMWGQPNRTVVIFQAADERLITFAPGTERLTFAEYLELLEGAQARSASSRRQPAGSCLEPSEPRFSSHGSRTDDALQIAEQERSW